MSIEHTKSTILLCDHRRPFFRGEQTTFTSTDSLNLEHHRFGLSVFRIFFFLVRRISLHPKKLRRFVLGYDESFGFFLL